MKKQTKILMVIGLILITFSVFTKPYFHISEDVIDFCKGVGVALVGGSLFVQKKLERKSADNISA